MPEINFRRVSAGLYRDAATGYTIERQGGATGRHDRADWYVMNPDRTVMRVSQGFAEAEMAAHKLLGDHA